MKRIDIPIIDRNNIDILNKTITCNRNLFDIVSVEALWNKYINNEEFTKEDLISLYDIYNTRYFRQNITLDESNTIYNIIEKRNKYKDIAKIFDCRKDEIASSEEVLKKDPSKYVVLWDSLSLDKNDNESVFKKLKHIGGYCDLNCYEYINGMFPLLETVYGSIYASKLITADGLEKLISLGNSAWFPYLKDAKGLCNLQVIGHNAEFNSLTDSYGLDKLKYIGRYAFFKSLTDISHLSSLEYIGGTVYFDSLSEENRNKIKKRFKKIW